jgi:hypothetical protein
MTLTKRKHASMSIRELASIVGRDPDDVQIRGKWVVCSFEPQDIGAVIRVLMPK